MIFKEEYLEAIELTNGQKQLYKDVCDIGYFVNQYNDKKIVRLRKLCQSLTPLTIYRRESENKQFWTRKYFIIFEQEEECKYYSGVEIEVNYSNTSKKDRMVSIYMTDKIVPTSEVKYLF